MCVTSVVVGRSTMCDSIVAPVLDVTAAAFVCLREKLRMDLRQISDKAHALQLDSHDDVDYDVLMYFCTGFFGKSDDVYILPFLLE